MPTKSEENKQVIQQLYDARGRVDTDALFASTHKGDPQERDRRVVRNMTIVAALERAPAVSFYFVENGELRLHRLPKLSPRRLGL